MKILANWLIGSQNDVVSARKTFRTLTAFLEQSEEIFGGTRISKPEKAWLRLSAGTVMLKICEQKGVGDQFTVGQFYRLAHLIADGVPEVRQRFAAKLHRHQHRSWPNRSLPLDFMGIYALAATEQDSGIKSIDGFLQIVSGLFNSCLTVIFTRHHSSLDVG